MASATFRIDDIVLDASKEIAKQFECAVCQHVAQEPVVQTPCGHIYCEVCLAPCSLCPQCRDPLEKSAVRPLREVNKMGLRMMQAIQVRCPYGSAAAAQAAGPSTSKRQRLEGKSKSDAKSGCNWQGTYGDLQAAHFAECPLYPVRCPQGCGELIARRDVPVHMLTCDRGFETCAICSDRVRVGTLAAHNEAAAVRHVELLQMRLHASEAAASQQASLDARLVIVEELLTAHRRDVKELIDSKAKLQLQKLAVWKLEGVAQLQRSMPLRKQCKTSPQFSLGGIEGFSFEFYPNGKATKEPWILIRNDPGHTDAIVKLSTCGVARECGHVKGKDTGLRESWDKQSYGFALDLSKLAGRDSFTVEAEFLSGGLICYV